MNIFSLLYILFIIITFFINKVIALDCNWLRDLCCCNCCCNSISSKTNKKAQENLTPEEEKYVLEEEIKNLEEELKIAKDPLKKQNLEATLDWKRGEKRKLERKIEAPKKLEDANKKIAECKQKIDNAQNEKDKKTAEEELKKAEAEKRAAEKVMQETGIVTTSVNETGQTTASTVSGSIEG